MIRYRTLAQTIKPKPANELFTQHIKLLIIMTKAFLKGNPLGDFRKAAIINTARFVFAHARSRYNRSLAAHHAGAPARYPHGHHHLDPIFLQRAQLLAVMANGFANGKASGQHRKHAMSENVQLISRYLTTSESLADSKIQKVA